MLENVIVDACWTWRSSFMLTEVLTFKQSRFSSKSDGVNSKEAGEREVTRFPVGSVGASLKIHRRRTCHNCMRAGVVSSARGSPGATYSNLHADGALRRRSYQTLSQFVYGFSTCSPGEIKLHRRAEGVHAPLKLAHSKHIGADKRFCMCESC